MEAAAREGGDGSVANVGVLPVPMLPNSNWGLKLVRVGFVVAEMNGFVVNLCRNEKVFHPQVGLV